MQIDCITVHNISKYSFFFLNHKCNLYLMGGVVLEGVTLDLYRVFVKVAQEGSFSAAARMLYLS